jgi:hypothetical protein
MKALRTTTVVAIAALALAGCGSSSKSGSSNSKKSEAASAATGDIPDNQVFLRYSGTGYSIKYPEGWTRKGSPTDITFSDKSNVVHLVLSRGPRPAPASVARGLPGVKERPTPVALKGESAIKVSYSKPGAANPVTAKRPLLVIDRYVYAKGGRVATLDLVTPKGVDNVDAYRLISQSFRWK